MNTILDFMASSHFNGVKGPSSLPCIQLVLSLSNNNTLFSNLSYSITKSYPTSEVQHIIRSPELQQLVGAGAMGSVTATRTYSGPAPLCSSYLSNFYCPPTQNFRENILLRNKPFSAKTTLCLWL
jgi:hypothetical protein